MSFFTSTTGLVIILVILILAFVARSIDWRAWAVKWVGQNPKHAAIYLDAGVITPVKGERTKVNKSSMTYHYKIDKEELTAIVPNSYGFKYLKNGRRIIGLQEGELIPNPLGFWDKTHLDKYAEEVTDISAIELSAFLVALVKSIKISRAFNWLMVIIIIGLAAAGYYWYTNQQKQKVAAPPNTANQTVVVTQTSQSVESIPGYNFVVK